MIFTRYAKLAPMLLAFLIASDAAIALAKPTPPPGGANQINGVQGTLAQTLFNGTLRLKSMSLGEPKASDSIRPAPGTHGVVFRAIVSNGTHHENHGYFNATLADADGITVEGRPLDDGWSLQPGTAARTNIGFNVPDGFVAQKLVLIQAATPKARAFRVTLRASDLPAAPAASPAP